MWYIQLCLMWTHFIIQLVALSTYSDYLSPHKLFVNTRLIALLPQVQAFRLSPHTFRPKFRDRIESLFSHSPAFPEGALPTETIPAQSGLHQWTLPVIYCLYECALQGTQHTATKTLTENLSTNYRGNYDKYWFQTRFTCPRRSQILAHLTLNWSIFLVTERSSYCPVFSNYAPGSTIVWIVWLSVEVWNSRDRCSIPVARRPTDLVGSTTVNWQDPYQCDRTQQGIELWSI